MAEPGGIYYKKYVGFWVAWNISALPEKAHLKGGYYRVNQMDKAQEEVKVIMDGRKIVNPFILNLAAKIAISKGNFAVAKEILDRQELVDRPENVAHRWAAYYMKKGDYTTALQYAKDACNGERLLR